MSTSTTTAHTMEKGRVSSGGGGDGQDADDNTGSWIFIGLNCAVYLLMSMACVVAVFCDRPAQVVVACSCLLCAVFYACVCIVTRLLITDPAAARVGGGNALDLFRVLWWIVDVCAVAVLAGAAMGVAAAMLVMYAAAFCVAGLLGWCVGEYLRTRNSAEVTSSGTEFERANSRVQVKVMTTSTMAPNTGHEPANDNGGVRSGRETAHTSSIQQELDCESLCALLGSVLAMVLVPVQLMLELSCVLSVVFYLWSFFVTRVLTKAEEGGCRLDRKTLLHVFLCAAGAGAAAALGGVMIGVVAAMLVMYITSPLVAGLFGWCLGEYLRTCRYPATGWSILQVDFISNH